MTLCAVADAAWLLLSERTVAEALADRAALLNRALAVEGGLERVELPTVAGRLDELHQRLQGTWEQASDTHPLIEAVLRRAG